MNKSPNGARAAAAAGVLLIGGAGTLAFWASTEAMQGLISVIPGQWADLIVAIGLVGYAAALLVAAFGTHRPRHIRS